MDSTGSEVHFSVPLNLPTSSLVGESSPPISALCYGVLGKNNTHFNLISGAGASVNAHYKASGSSEPIIIDQIAIKAVDVRGLTHNISVNLSCLAQINGTDVAERYDSNGIGVLRTSNRSVLVSVPNCSPNNYNPLKIQITCRSLANKSNQMNVIMDERINVNQKSHGIIGKWRCAI